MRFLSQTHCCAAAAVALALLATTAQAQGLRVPGQSRAPQAGDASVSRALDDGQFTGDLAGGRPAIGTDAAAAAVIRQLQIECHVVELRD